MNSYQKLKQNNKELQEQLTELVLHPDSEKSNQIRFRITWVIDKTKLLCFGSPRKDNYAVGLYNTFEGNIIGEEINNSFKSEK